MLGAFDYRAITTVDFRDLSPVELFDTPFVSSVEAAKYRRLFANDRQPNRNQQMAYGLLRFF